MTKPSKGAIGVAVEIEGMLLKNGWILSETLVNPCPSIAALIDDHFKPAKEALEEIDTYICQCFDGYKIGSEIIPTVTWQSILVTARAGKKCWEE